MRGLHLHVKTDVSAFGPSKTQCFLMILPINFDSGAEWLRYHAASIGFYNGLFHFWALRFKSIIFCDVSRVSKHSCFSLFFDARQTHFFTMVYAHFVIMFTQILIEPQYLRQ